MLLFGCTHLLSTCKCYFSSWVWSWHSSLKRDILFQSPLFNFPCPCVRIFLQFNPSRAGSARVICSPKSLLGEGCPSPCLWHTPPQPPPSTSGGWNPGETFCLNASRGQVKNYVDVKGKERQKYLGEEGLSQTAGKWARQAAWPLSFSCGETQAMLQALQSKNKPQFVPNFHFSPLSHIF